MVDRVVDYDNILIHKTNCDQTEFQSASIFFRYCRYAVNYMVLITQHLHLSNVNISIKLNFKQNGIRRNLTSENYRKECLYKEDAFVEMLLNYIAFHKWLFVDIRVAC